MSIYYLDTSAVLKLYLGNELGSEFMRTLIEGATSDESFYISSFGLLEVKAAIVRRVSDAGVAGRALSQFSQDMADLLKIVRLNEYILYRALSATENYRLRAGDAIHLATALSIAAMTEQSQLFMISSDAELLDAFIAAGIGALDPQADDAMDSLRQIRE
ncbi:MAG: type II toxin-antitoxin system VapC family toxin [Chloroflexota bacterium]|nr:type II toxin-antitoxin system VapC family toxin [Chloroflexota bacterium]